VDYVGLVIAGLVVLFVVISVLRSVRIVPQARAGIVERLGRYNRTLDAGLKLLIPFVDKVRPLIDLREQVVSFPPQPVITEDNLVVSIDTVLYFQVTDAKAATYEIANYIHGIEQLTVTTLRNVIGGLDLEQTLTSREEINRALRGVLDEATGKWGIRVNRVELKAIDPPHSIQDSMEKQMRADRDKRAAILTAEGVRQSQILTAEGEKQSAILRAQGDREGQILRAQADREAQILRAEGEAQAIDTVFDAIHTGAPDQALLSYQYLQMLPQIAQGDANKVWIVPSELGKALEGLGSVVGQFAGGSHDDGPQQPPRPPRPPRKPVERAVLEGLERPDSTQAEEAAQDAVAEAIAEAESASRRTTGRGGTPDGLARALGADGATGLPEGQPDADGTGQHGPDAPAGNGSSQQGSDVPATDGSTGDRSTGDRSTEDGTRQPGA
jgi:regulator of protease activity HflC (stomatin/prohibitin superfamily)